MFGLVNNFKIRSLFSLLFFCCFAQADSTPPAIVHLSELGANALAEKLSSQEIKAEIRFPSIDKLATNASFAAVVDVRSVRLIEEKANAVASFAVVCSTLGTDGNEKLVTKIVHLPFEAWVSVPVATHRIYPNRILKPEDFKVQPVNVAQGMAREYRGILASPRTEFQHLQSKQTILEGQFLTTVATQHEPDVKRGEMVKLELTSGDLSLTTQGVAQEMGTVGERIHVLTTKTKRDVTGVVRADHSVEVKL